MALKKPIILILIALLTINTSLVPSLVFSHSGRTDSQGGHWDRKYGTGYHYHHGYPAHQHPNGVCPYLQPQNSKNKNAEEIKAIQEKLIELGYDPGTADGINGPKTKEVIKQFQKDNGLVPDGICGPKTKEKLGL